MCASTDTERTRLICVYALTGDNVFRVNCSLQQRSLSQTHRYKYILYICVLVFIVCVQEGWRG